MAKVTFVQGRQRQCTPYNNTYPSPRNKHASVSQTMSVKVVSDLLIALLTFMTFELHSTGTCSLPLKGISHS